MSDTRGRTMLGAAVALAAAVTLLWSTAQAAPEAALDGSTFAITMKEAGRKGSGGDTLIFKAGRLDSVGCRKYGFVPGPYKATRDGEGWRFTARSTSRKEGVNEWSGTVNAGTIRGKLVWSKANQRPITYTFSGRKTR